MHLLHILLASPWLSFCAAANIPWKSWTFCKKSDPKRNECLLAAIKAVEKDVYNGNAYFGTNSLDPLHITEIVMDQTSPKSPVSIKLTLSDVDILRLRSWNIQATDINWETGSLVSKINFNEPLTILGNYKINGKVLLLPISGQGKCNFTLETVEGDLIFKGKSVERKGEKYFHTELVDFLFNTTRLHIYMETLFNGNKALGDNMNTFLNENWTQILKELNVSLRAAFGEALKQIANKVFEKIPLKILNPE